MGSGADAERGKGQGGLPPGEPEGRGRARRQGWPRTVFAAAWLARSSVTRSWRSWRERLFSKYINDTQIRFSASAALNIEPSISKQCYWCDRGHGLARQ